MRLQLKTHFEAELAQAWQHWHAGDLARAMWDAERAHVLGQRHVRPHVRSHWLMLRIGLKRRSAREAIGQLLRIGLGALGSAVGIVPVGNTGGTNIGMFRRLPVEAKLAEILRPR